MAKIRMGDLLVRAGLITESDLRVALAQQKQHGGKLGEHLVRVNLLTEDTLARALAQQLGLQFNDMSEPPRAAISGLLPEKAAARLQALPTTFDARTGLLSVAVSDPLDEDALAEVAHMTGKQVVAQVTPANVLRRAIEHAYFGVELSDEGTREFQLVDIHGRGTTVKVNEEQELPEIGNAELTPLSDDDVVEGELAPLDAQPEEAPAKPGPMRIEPTAHVQAQPQRPPFPPPAGARQSSPGQATPAPRTAPPPPVAQPQTPSSQAGDEALGMVWAIAELLIERGYFTRAELMRHLRSK